MQRILLNSFRSICRTSAFCRISTVEQPDALESKEIKDIPLKFDDVSVLDSKTVPEILRGLFVLKLSSVDYIVDNNVKLMNRFQKVLGRRAFEKCMQASVYGHLVAGEDFEDIQGVTRKLAAHGIRPIIFMPDEEDLGAEGGSVDKYDKNMHSLARSMGAAKQLCAEKPISQCRITALVPMAICAKLTSSYTARSEQHNLVDLFADAMSNNKQVHLDVLDDSENEELNSGLRRLKTLSQKSLESGVVILIDAEQTYSNPAISVFAMAMMLYTNTDKPFIWKTYQAYLKDTQERLEGDFAFVLSRGRSFGYKLVRGAYLELEKRWALEHGLPNPNFPNIEATHASYHKALEFILNKIVENPGKINFMTATHNERSIHFMTKSMEELNIPRDNDYLVFGQTYALSDHISYSLGKAGYVIYKSVPCGTIDVCLEYFARRAQENRLAVDGLRNDIPYLKAALFHRMKKKFS